ncbi:MAG: hypothetical protein NZT61_07785, partial [Deltaproteobacteria bacterium]|nr:hypothetical protein [Deltaproteobacteria bacterium]
EAWQHLGFDRKHLRTSSNLSWVTRAMRGKNVGAFITDLFVNPEVARSAPDLFKPLTQAISEILTKASGVPILEEELKILCGIDRP